MNTSFLTLIRSTSYHSCLYFRKNCLRGEDNRLGDSCSIIDTPEILYEARLCVVYGIMRLGSHTDCISRDFATFKMGSLKVAFDIDVIGAGVL